eukprot:gnl/TRDRNA2_/TRDRNA2_79914_c0_seq1.p1 gnl/TRDRNA2_/TRDRNA2_79914_c0~~gnl/TRDRNA2_/TRDRNA2_79914_c0_seq1.p1  ORF type:complete len:463 (-),score=86.87 gnl/TRDRNA2_/TRDRNA2_79914_c0_seq1:116-1357(-)
MRLQRLTASRFPHIPSRLHRTEETADCASSTAWAGSQFGASPRTGGCRRHKEALPAVDKKEAGSCQKQKSRVRKHDTLYWERPWREQMSQEASARDCGWRRLAAPPSMWVSEHTQRVTTFGAGRHLQSENPQTKSIFSKESNFLKHCDHYEESQIADVLTSLQDLKDNFQKLSAPAHAGDSEQLSAAKLGPLAKEMQLSLNEIRLLKAVFDDFDIEGTGTLSLDQFEPAVVRVIEMVAKTNQMVSAQRVKAMREWYWWSPDKEVLDFREFLKWYCANGFTREMMITEAEAELRDLAMKLGTTLDFAEQIKQLFDAVDPEGCGEITRKSFLPLLRSIWHFSDSEEANMTQEKVKRLWKEIDADDSGTVTFEELLRWRLKYYEAEKREKHPAPFQDSYRQCRPRPMPQHRTAGYD